MRRAVLLTGLLLLGFWAAVAPGHAGAARRSVRCCFESDADAVPGSVCVNFKPRSGSRRYARLSARVLCRLAGGEPQRRAAP